MTDTSQFTTFHPPRGRRRSRPVHAVVALAATIVGCVVASPALSQQSQQHAPPESPAVPADALPDVSLTGPLLYQIMAAEVALQRGEAGAAYSTYMSVAKQTRDPRLARRAVEIAFGGRASTQALEAAQLWRELAPRSAEAAQMLAAMLVANNRYVDAAPMLAAQLKSAANPIEELGRIQRTLARGPDRAGAFKLLDDLAQPYRDDARGAFDVRLILAGGAHAAGLTARAAQEARAALQLQPGSERAALVAAQLLARPDGKDSVDGRAQALALLQDFLERKPESAEVRLNFARLLISDNKLPAARDQFGELLKRDERNLDALYALGVLALEGKPPRTEARSFFARYLKALEEAPGAGRDPHPAYLNLARIAEDERKYDEALQWLERVDDGEQFVTARARQALVLGKLKRVDEGRSLLAATAAESSRTEEEKTQIVVAEGQLLREAKRYAESFTVLSAALAKSPDNTSLLYDTAMAAEKLDHVDVMETHLRRMMKLKPDDAHAFNALGYTFADRNMRLQEAEELVAQALKLSPADAYILDSMGWVYYRLGNLAKAREYLERAWASKPEGEVGAHLGEVLWQMGEREQARRVWREAHAVEPDNEALSTTLARFKVKL